MSVKCKNYLKFKPLLTKLRQSLDDTAFLEYITEHFENADQVYGAFTSGKPKSPTGNPPSKDAGIAADLGHGRGIEASSQDSVQNLFIGNASAYTNLKRDFARKIVSNSIFDIDTYTFIDANADAIDNAGNAVGLSNLNYNILKYKYDLINTIRTTIHQPNVNFDPNISDEAFTNIVNETLQLYDNYNEEKQSVFNAYVQLLKFDELLKNNTPFIVKRNAYKNSVYQHKDAYQYKGPTVNHFYKFGDESADAFGQASDLAKVLLNVLPELNSENDPISNTSIGLEGFTSAMSSLKNALMYPIPGSIMVEVSPEVYKGAQANMSSVLDTYITWLQNSGRLPENRRTFLITKLRAIKHFIYDSNIDQNIKNMFTAMFLKNVPVNYQAYQYDFSEHALKGNNLKSGLVNIQKGKLQDMIKSSIRIFQQDPSYFNGVLTNYGITIDPKSRSINIKPSENEDASIHFEYKNGRYIFKEYGHLDDETALNLFKDLTSYLLPNEFINLSHQVFGNQDSLFKQVKDILGIVLTAGGNTIKYPLDKGLFDFKSYHTLLDPIANVMNVMYGSDTRSVVKNLAGNNVPTTQLINLAYNAPALIHKIKNSAKEFNENRDIPDKRFNIYENNLIFENDGFIQAPFIRSDVLINGVSKSPSQMSVAEVMSLSILEDFYDKIKSGTILLQSTTFADKNTHFLIPFNISQDITLAEKTYNLQEIINDSLKTGNTSKLQEIFQETRYLKIDNVYSNILKDWNKAYPNQSFTTFEQIDNFIAKNKLSVNNIQEAFKDADLDCFENIHYYKDAKTKQLRMNETIKNWKQTFDSKDKTKERLNRNRKNFLKNLIENRVQFNKYRSATVNKLASRKIFAENGWFPNNTGDMLLAKIRQNGKLITVTENNISLLNDPNVTVELNPLLETYFMTDILLSNEYNSLMMGEVYAHPNKNKEGKLDSAEYYEFSEANRLIAQNKRAVIMGATYHPFLQGLKYGTASTINIATINDMQGNVWNLTGEEKTDLETMDGSGLSSPYQARFENNSALDARVGYDKKTIMGDVDPIYGRPTLLKWAVYALNNTRRRLSKGSKVSGEKVFKKMHSIPIGKYIDLGHYFDTFNTDNDYSKNIYFFNEEDQKWYWISDIKSEYDKVTGNIKITRTIQPADKYGTIDTTQTIPQKFTYHQDRWTIYDIDQIFGGAYTGDLDTQSGKLEYTEYNLDIVEKLVGNEDIKDKMISYLVNKTAIKVGAGNINAEAKWENDEAFDSFKMSTEFGGIQMNAEHELDDTEVTEMTQMLSALVENGYSLNIVNQIYSDIGQIVEESLKEFNQAIADVVDKDKLYRLLGKALMDAFLTNDRDTIGLAQSFIMKANESLQDANIKFKIPFSAPTIKNAFLATITSLINKKGIRRKYAGFAGVLTPSFNMMQYYTLDGINVTYDNLAKRIKLKKDLLQSTGQHPNWWNAKIEDFINKTHINGDLNPYLEELTTPQQLSSIDFEDTIVINAGQPDQETIYIDSFTAYDNFKHRVDLDGKTIHRWASRPKNLKQSNTKFIINGLTYSIYDLDSVRISHYLSRKDITPEQLVFAQERYGNLSNAELKQAADQETKRILRALEKGREFRPSQAFGSFTTTVKADSYWVEPAEIITGRLNASKFGLDLDENVSDVLIEGPSFFERKLEAKYELPDIDSELYDFVLYLDDGNYILVKVGDEESLQKQLSKTNLSKDSTFKIVDNQVYYNDSEFTSSNDKHFYSVIDGDGIRRNIITVNDYDRLTELLNTEQVQNYRTNFNNSNYKQSADYVYRNKDLATLKLKTSGGRLVEYQYATPIILTENEEIEFQKRNKALAKKQYEAFEKSLNLVGARIPTQGMQSFMPMRIVAFTDSEINDIYVPRAQTWLEGSDYWVNTLL